MRENEAEQKREQSTPTPQEDVIYRTAFAWKAEKKTPDDQFHAMLLAKNWSDVQRLSEKEYDEGTTAGAQAAKEAERKPEERKPEERKPEPHRPEPHRPEAPPPTFRRRS